MVSHLNWWMMFSSVNFSEPTLAWILRGNDHFTSTSALVNQNTALQTDLNHGQNTYWVSALQFPGNQCCVGLEGWENYGSVFGVFKNYLIFQNSRHSDKRKHTRKRWKINEVNPLQRFFDYLQDGLKSMDEMFLLIDNAIIKLQLDVEAQRRVNLLKRFFKSTEGVISLNIPA